MQPPIEVAAPSIPHAHMNSDLPAVLPVTGTPSQPLPLNATPFEQTRTISDHRLSLPSSSDMPPLQPVSSDMPPRLPPPRPAPTPSTTEHQPRRSKRTTHPPRSLSPQMKGQHHRYNEGTVAEMDPSEVT